MPFIKECCETPPVQVNYTPIGKTFKLKDDLDCYGVGDTNAKAAIIYIYDIYCLHPNAYQGCDILAKSGFRVIMPDFLRYEKTLKPLMDDPVKYREVIRSKGTYEALKDDFEATKNYIKNIEGFENVALIGFCWGAKKVMNLSAHDSFYKAGALVHPSLLELNDFENAQCPMVFLPSKSERDFTEDFAVISAKPFGSLCYHQRFDDMIHGWCAARGEWADAHIASRANEAFSIVVSNFRKILKL
ncbi:hypothetical protein BB558_007162 [Smittium angustum]|uniref:Dienelactone hydrolase domain-containing protein n=1 Tax=Smittium angustum TaxID=133377 RepID=A0A2U1IVU2_SMIAN|nr:hypothetical protein BB558_007162 [Smittium angustum]